MIKFFHFRVCKIEAYDARKTLFSCSSTLDIVTFLTMKNRLQKKVENL